MNYYDMERRSVKGSARVFSLITLQRHYRCLALVKYWTGGWSYILGVEGLGRGIIVQNCGDSRSNAGSLAEIGRLMPGTFVCNIPWGSFGSRIKAPGTYGKILKPIEEGFSRVRFKRKWLVSLPNNTIVTIGRVSGRFWKLKILGKAGVRRGWGIRPKVRGTAMNAVDHPHGGKSGPSRTSIAPWGWPTK